MDVAVLGPIRVQRGTGGRALTGTLQGSLLGLLAARANRSVSAERLIDLLWGGTADDGARRRLQVHVHRLRQLLGEPDRITFDEGGYRLHVDPDELDADRFERLVDQAVELSARDPDRCAELVREALDLWRGPPYDGVDIAELSHESARLDERRLSALETLYGAELASGRHHAAVSDLTELTRRHPLRERFHGLLMTALALGGRQADALRVFREARHRLVDELGLEPGVELRQLERRIIAGESVHPPGAVDAAASERETPAQLPAGPASFVGRTDELAALDRALLVDGEGAPVCVLAGSAGVGKTTLAVHWAHRSRDAFPDGQLYVDLRGHAPDGALDAADALAGFLRSLGVDGAAIPVDVAERSARLRSLLAERRLLLVLDNARSVDQVRPLLPGTGRSAVLVTSRDRLMGLAARDGATRIELDRMTHDDAERLLVGLLGDRGGAVDADDTRRLIDACASLPLALCIAAERLRARRDRGIAALLEELADEQARLDVLDVAGDPHSSVRGVFSWSYQQLDAGTARAFRCLGVAPCRDVDVHGVAAIVAAPDRRSATRVIDALVAAHLVEETAPGRYRMHDLLRAYGAELAGDEGLEVARRLRDYYLSTAVTAMARFAPQGVERPPVAATAPVSAPSFDRRAAVRWLDTERDNLLQAAASGDPVEAARYTTDLSSVLWRYLDAGGYLDDARWLHRRACDAAVELGDRWAEAIALRNLGVVHQRSDQFGDILTCLEGARAILLELDHPESLAITLNALGSVHHTAGRMDEAMACMTASWELLHALGDPAKQATPRHNLGYFLLREGRHGEALDHLEAALELAEAHDDRIVAAHAARSLAELCREMGRFDDALAHARRSVTLADEHGVAKVLMGAVSILGSVHRHRGDHDEALRQHRRAVELAERWGSMQPIAIAINELAATHAAAGEWDEAGELYRSVAATAAEREVPHESAAAWTGLGDVADRRGDRNAAIRHWRRAIDILRVVGDDVDVLEARVTAAQRPAPGR